MDNRERKDLVEIAMSIRQGHIFTNRHITNVGDVTMVFMPLALMGKDQLKQLYDQKPGLFFQYVSKAGSRSINGMPTFTSMEILSEHDDKIVMEMIKRLKAGSDKMVLELESGH